MVTIISNNEESRALERARAAGIPAYHLSSRTHRDPAALDAAICQCLVESGADAVLLAGYVNHVHRAVLAAGERTTGASVRVVSEEYDEVPVLAQREVPVELTDTPETLAEHVERHERSLVVETFGAIAAGRLRLPVAKGDAPPNHPLQQTGGSHCSPPGR